MNARIADSLARRNWARHDRRGALSAFVAAVFATSKSATPAANAKNAKDKAKRKTRKSVRKAVQFQCGVQIPQCELSLSVVCQPGPDVQECLDNTSLCCELLADCDAAAAVACIVTNFIV